MKRIDWRLDGLITMPYPVDLALINFILKGQKG